MIVVLLFCMPSASAQDTVAGGPVDLFKNRSDGYRAFRVPALLTTASGTLIAVCEGRRNSSVFAWNDLVMKRSIDGGKSWEPIQLIDDRGYSSINNPTLLEDRNGRLIYLFYQVYSIDDRKMATGDLFGDLECRTYYRISADEGSSWSPPNDVTDVLVSVGAAGNFASGPGVGVQMTEPPCAGRLVVPFNQGKVGNWKVFSLYSDNGLDWNKGGHVPDNIHGSGTEAQIAVLSDGTLFLVARSAGGNNLRKTAYSFNGGRTWTAFRDEPALPDPECMGSLIAGEDASGHFLLYSSPSDPSRRRSGEIRISRDDGTTWKVIHSFGKGSFGYSCLAVLPGGTIGLMYEYGRSRSIRFAVIPMPSAE